MTEYITTYGPLQQAEATVYQRKIDHPNGSSGAIITDAVSGLEFRTLDHKIIPLTFAVLALANFSSPYGTYRIVFEDLAAELTMGSMLDIGDRVTLDYQSKTMVEKQGPIMKLLGAPLHPRTTTLVRSVETDLFLFSLKEDERAYKLTLKKPKA